MPSSIPFIDIEAQQARIRESLDRRLQAVLAHGQYIMGPEVAELETALSSFCGAKHSISCSSGTDALLLALKALGVGKGDAVLVPTFTFAATAEVVPWLNAVPVFVDILPDSFNIDPRSVEAGIETAKRAGLKPAGIVAVDLFGQPADYPALHRIAEADGLWVLADAAQSFGAEQNGTKAGALARVTTTSFFPAKPLGCFGDGGAVFTDDDDLAATMRSLRVHGKGQDKYDNVVIGMNARLDTLQAAVLLAKLEVFGDELSSRGEVADRYNDLLAGLVTVPGLDPGNSSAWAQYTVRSDRRDAVRAHLGEAGIPSVVYYVKPLHLQTAYRDFPVAGPGCPVSEEAAGSVLSLPMHPYLEAATQARIAAVLADALAGEPALQRAG